MTANWGSAARLGTWKLEQRGQPAPAGRRAWTHWPAPRGQRALLDQISSKAAAQRQWFAARTPCDVARSGHKESSPSRFQPASGPGARCTQATAPPLQVDCSSEPGCLLLRCWRRREPARALAGRAAAVRWRRESQGCRRRLTGEDRQPGTAASENGASSESAKRRPLRASALGFDAHGEPTALPSVCLPAEPTRPTSPIPTTRASLQAATPANHAARLTYSAVRRSFCFPARPCVYGHLAPPLHTPVPHHHHAALRPGRPLLRYVPASCPPRRHRSC